MQKNRASITKVALITGAARRIGADIARILHDAGMQVIIHYHTSRDDAEQLCQELNQQRENSAVLLQADLMDIANHPELMREAVSAWGRLDVLVNNASRFYRTKLGEVTEWAWDDLLNSNLKAPFFLSQAAQPHLHVNKGCIINITDIHGERPMRDYSAYCISKAGLIMLTRVLAKELGPAIRVNAISPGAMIWPEGDNVMSEDEKQKIISRTALQCAGSAAEIAKAVLFFVNGADYITGQVLAVDGGRSLMI